MDAAVEVVEDVQQGSDITSSPHKPTNPNTTEPHTAVVVVVVVAPKHTQRLGTCIMNTLLLESS